LIRFALLDRFWMREVWRWKTQYDVIDNWQLIENVLENSILTGDISLTGAAEQLQNDDNIDFLAMARKSILCHSDYHFVITFVT
jgi:hypothetical protein